MAALIELDGISKTYPMPGGDVHALRSLSLSSEGWLCSIFCPTCEPQSNLHFGETISALMTEETNW